MKFPWSSKPSFHSLQKELELEVEAAWNECRASNDNNYPGRSIRSYPAGRKMVAMPLEERAHYFVEALRHEPCTFESRHSTFGGKNIARALMTSPLPLTADQVVKAMGIVSRWPDYFQSDIDMQLLRFVRPYSQDPHVRAALEKWKQARFGKLEYWYKKDIAALREFDAVRLGLDNSAFVAVEDWEIELSRALGNRLYKHLREAKGVKLTERWRKEVVPQVPPVAVLTEAGRTLLGKLKSWPKSITGEHSKTLRGFAWLLRVCPDDTTFLQIELGLAFCRKVPVYGPLCPPAANAIIETLGALGSLESLSGLTLLRQKTPPGKLNSTITATLEEVAKSRGLTLFQLEASAVPTFDLGADGILETPTEGGKLRVTLSDRLQVSLDFVKSDGKVIKTLPQTEEVTTVKETAKALKDAVAAQIKRLERLNLYREATPYAWWKTYTKDHPIVGRIARLLIWEIDGVAVEIVGGVLRTIDGEPYEPIDSASVILWHPLSASEEVRQRWRIRVESWPIPQPFKQAHREMYAPTEGEKIDFSSDRFSGHVVRQHQLLKIAHARGWNYHLQSQFFDSGNDPTLEFGTTRVTLNAETVADEKGGSTKEAISLHVMTGSVKFEENRGVILEDRGYGVWEFPNLVAIRIGDLDPVVYSEVMRDVDLFVSAAGATHDPSFDTRETPADVRELSATARIRADVLSRLLPRLGLTGAYEIDGRFLRVQGQLAKYDVHLGSGNLFVHPGRSLSIEVGSGPDTALPFEGDATLARIVALARLLVNDATEFDSSLRKQVER